MWGHLHRIARLLTPLGASTRFNTSSAVHVGPGDTLTLMISRQLFVTFSLTRVGSWVNSCRFSASAKVPGIGEIQGTPAGRRPEAMRSAISHAH